MKKKILVVAMLMMGLVSAQNGPRMGPEAKGANSNNKKHHSEWVGRGFGYFDPRMQDSLNLSAEQKNTLNKYAEAHHKARRSWGTEIAAHEKSLREAIQQQDEKKIKEQAAAVQQLQNQQLTQRIEFMVKMRSVLTAEQAQKMQELQARKPEFKRGKAHREKGGDKFQYGSTGRGKWRGNPSPNS